MLMGQERMRKNILKIDVSEQFGMSAIPPLVVM